jgi:hypothetical protein
MPGTLEIKLDVDLRETRRAVQNLMDVRTQMIQETRREQRWEAGLRRDFVFHEFRRACDRTTAAVQDFTTAARGFSERFVPDPTGPGFMERAKAERIQELRGIVDHHLHGLLTVNEAREAFGLAPVEFDPVAEWRRSCEDFTTSGGLIH